MSGSTGAPWQHPAVHNDKIQAPVTHRLFPRAADVQEERRLRAEAMKRHPAGKGGSQRPEPVTAAQPIGTAREAQKPSRTPDAVPATRHEPGSGPRVQRRTAPSKTYTVQAGDSLWAIACRAAAPTDAERVRALTRQLYRLNRDVVGANPDLILPGQVLRLPLDLQR